MTERDYRVTSGPICILPTKHYGIFFLLFIRLQEGGRVGARGSGNRLSRKGGGEEFLEGGAPDQPNGGLIWPFLLTQVTLAVYGVSLVKTVDM